MARGSEIHSRPSMSRADRIETLIRAYTAHPCFVLADHSDRQTDRALPDLRLEQRRDREEAGDDGDRTRDIHLGKPKPRTVQLSA
jgi:hypothetical protein